MPSLARTALLAAAALSSLVTADDDYNTNGQGKQTRCTDDNDNLCLETFVFCNNGCDFPEYTYPYHYNMDSNSATSGAVISDVDYNITWKNADQDKDVYVTWNIPDMSSKETVKDAVYINYTKKVDAGTNYFIANFEDMAGSISGYSTSAIMGLAQDADCQIVISQHDNYTSSSDYLNIYNWYFTDYAGAQYDKGQADEYDTWELGVGIGVGVGVPILLAITGLAAFLMGKKVGAKAGMQQKEAHGETSGDASS